MQATTNKANTSKGKKVKAKSGAGKTVKAGPARRKSAKAKTAASGKAEKAAGAGGAADNGQPAKGKKISDADAFKELITNALKSDTMGSIKEVAERVDEKFIQFEKSAQSVVETATQSAREMIEKKKPMEKIKMGLRKALSMVEHAVADMPRATKKKAAAGKKGQ